MNANLYGKYHGICQDIADPEGLRRIKVKVPALFGQEVLEEWALPCLPPGINALPKKGDGVWVEFAGGDENAPIWSGVWISKKESPISASELQIKVAGDLETEISGDSTTSVGGNTNTQVDGSITTNADESITTIAGTSNTDISYQKTAPVKHHP